MLTVTKEYTVESFSKFGQIKSCFLDKVNYKNIDSWLQPVTYIYIIILK